MCCAEGAPHHLFLCYALQQVCHPTSNLTAAAAAAAAGGAAIAALCKQLLYAPTLSATPCCIHTCIAAAAAV
jgi:hypothetical protein